MKRFRNRPVIVEAAYWDGKAETCHPIIQWINETDACTATYREKSAEFRSANGEWMPTQIRIQQPEGTMSVTAGHWVVKAWGEFYPVTEPIFHESYAAVDDAGAIIPDAIAIPAEMMERIETMPLPT